MNTKLLQVTLSMASVALAANAMADENSPPRGIDIRPLASACNIGPFGQTGKAGSYNSLCSTLTDAEKCLALVKRHMNVEGNLTAVGHDADRASYCLDEFRRQLLANPAAE